MTTLLKAKIYKIVCNKTKQIYIGSTIKDLEERLHSHELDFIKYCRNRYHYVTSFSILCNNDYKIELITDVICSSKQELRKIEGAFVRDNEDICVNKLIPGRDKATYYKETQKKHKCECGGTYTLNKKTEHMESDQHIEYVNAVWEEYA